MSDLEPLPPDLRSLFADERAAYPDDRTARDRVMRRIETSITFAAVGATGAGAAAAAATKPVARAVLDALLAKHAKVLLVVSLGLGIAVGETHARLVAPPAPVTPSSTSGVATSVPPPPPSTPISSEQVASPSIDVSSPPRSPPPPPSTSSKPAPANGTPERISDLAAEQAIIDTARAALSRSRGADALAAADAHASRFPRGRLSEEREMVAIQALLQLGRRVEAETRAQRFHKSYPQSLYGSAVDALLAKSLAPKNDGSAP